MTKKEYNLKFKSHIDECKVDFDMLIQGYALLDKQVSKYAYLKKKYANSGKTIMLYRKNKSDANTLQKEGD